MALHGVKENAYLALEGTLPGVQTHVVAEMAALSEPLVAHIALVGPFARVEALVVVEVPALGEALVAVLALVGPVVGVHPGVAEQVAALRELLLAHLQHRDIMTTSVSTSSKLGAPRGGSINRLQKSQKAVSEACKQLREHSVGFSYLPRDTEESKREGGAVARQPSLARQCRLCNSVVCYS